MNLKSMPTRVFLSLVVSEFSMGCDTLGILTAALGVGALLASLSVAARRSVLGLGSLIGWTSGEFGVGKIDLACSHVCRLSSMAMLGSGFAMIAQMAASNTIMLPLR